MKIHQLIEGRDAPLYHGVSAYYAIEQLQKNRIEGRTTQRFWPDGRRLKDNHPDYNDSFWLKGISLTRSLAYAQHMGGVVYVLDQAKLTQRYKIIPHNWGYSIPQGNHHKREQEEFLVLGRIFKSLNQFIEEYHNARDELWDKYHKSNNSGNQALAAKIKQELDDMPDVMDAWQGPTQTNLDPLDHYLLKIYAIDSIQDSPKNKFDSITSHPKFAGFYSY